MNRLGCLVAALAVLGTPARAVAGSHPAGVTYPLRPAVLQPAGLAQPLPSTRRYVLVWKDQLADAVQSISAAQKDFIVTHYVGSQKLFAHQIDEYRKKNPGFLMLVYHLAYGLNGADQTNPVSNIVGPEKYGQEDTEVFTPYVAAHSLERENAYQHTSTPGTSTNRVSYPDPYWLMDIASTEWRSYLYDTLVTWQGYPASKATGVFLDVAFPPWYNYTPDAWWAMVARNDTRAALRDFWNPRALAYFNAMRDAFAPSAAHPRYLVIPNTDALVDGTDEPAFLDGTDGVFTENWQSILGASGDERLSLGRILKYVTSQGKVWLADVTQAGTDLSPSEREQLIGAYLLVRNGTSYVMFGNSDVTWYPEYEIDLGAYDAEPPLDLEALRVAGSGGSTGGLYLRKYASGLVLVNTSDTAYAYPLPAAMKRAAFTGGGAVGTDGTLPAYTLTYAGEVPAGMFAVQPHSAAVLRDPAGPPPAGEEPGAVDPDAGAGGAPGNGGTPASGGVTASGGATTGGAGAGSGSGGASPISGSGGADAGRAGANASGGRETGSGASTGDTDAGTPAHGGAPSKSADTGGCGCRTAPARNATDVNAAFAVLGLLIARRRRRA
jgi:MYXO-CTERM domain-containing protein